MIWSCVIMLLNVVLMAKILNVTGKSLVKKVMQNRKEHFGKLRLIYDGRRNSLGLHDFDLKPVKICWIWQCFTWSFGFLQAQKSKKHLGCEPKPKKRFGWTIHSITANNSDFHFPSFFVSVQSFQSCSSISES